jgi:hypothetical protein
MELIGLERRVDVKPLCLELVKDPTLWTPQNCPARLIHPSTQSQYRRMNIYSFWVLDTFLYMTIKLLFYDSHSYTGQLSL